MNLTYISALDAVPSTVNCLKFNETPPYLYELFSENLNGYCIEGRALYGVEKENHRCLFSIHGARSGYSSLNSILYPLQLLGVSSLSFNLSGHSVVSGVEIEATSLEQNLQESLCFLSSRGEAIHNILGFSLGGALALKVAEVHRDSVRRIVLISPALYTEQAYQVPFGPLFKKTISYPFSFLDSTSLSFLKTFKGKMLLIMGEYDGLSAKDYSLSAGTSVGSINVKDKTLPSSDFYSAIPSEVISAIEENINFNDFQKIILSGCDHSVMSWLREKPDVAKKLSQKIAIFLNE